MNALACTKAGESILFSDYDNKSVSPKIIVLKEKMPDCFVDKRDKNSARVKNKKNQLLSLFTRRIFFPVSGSI